MICSLIICLKSTIYDRKACLARVLLNKQAYVFVYYSTYRCD